jgi:NSS family neurotransmitter:Na+ symporter
MWADACAQIFFSLGICMGTMTSYASFNDVKKPIIGDTFKICLTNSCISFFAGFAVFSVVGYLTEIGSPVQNKVSSIGLAFVAYPAAIETMPASNFWSLILAITLFSLGIDSAFSMLEACATVLADTAWGREMPRKLIALLLCVTGCAFTALFCFNWGFTYFDVVDHYLTVYLMLLVGIFEVFGAGWVYEASYVMEKFGKAPVVALIAGYWASLSVISILTFTVFPEFNWVGMLLFWVCVLITFAVSWLISG